MLPLDLFKGKLALEMLSDWFNNKSFGISVSTTVEWFSAGLFSIQIIFTRSLLARERERGGGGIYTWSNWSASIYVLNLGGIFVFFVFFIFTRPIPLLARVKKVIDTRSMKVFSDILPWETDQWRLSPAEFFQRWKKSRWKINQDSSGWRSGYSSPPWKKTLSSKETM